jgi:hypothetical protein
MQPDSYIWKLIAHSLMEKRKGNEREKKRWDERNVMGEDCKNEYKDEISKQMTNKIK